MFLVANGDKMNKIDFCEFLESSSLYEHVEAELSIINRHGNISIDPDIVPTFHCNSCSGFQKFDVMSDTVSENVLNRNSSDINRILYRCRNCLDSYKTFSIRLIYTETLSQLSTGKYSFKFQKVGEYPERITVIPKRVEKLLGGDKYLFHKGLRCESLGLGIAAFSYYRRVIESKKSAIFNDIIKVLKIDGRDNKLIEELETAKLETQFSNSIESINEAFPDFLRVHGEDPFKLIYRALSDGLHSKDDLECLQKAKDIKVLLLYLIEKIEFALGDDKALKDAVERLRK